jgi:DNA polymerase-4
MPRVLLHADLDAFYASVEQLDDPSLRGRPVIVGGSPESRGVVAAASYEARAHGVHSAQPMRIALLRCPTAVRLPPRFQRYRELSDQVFAVYRRWTPLVEPLSLDEAYLDISSHLDGATPDAVRDAASRLKAEIHEATGLTLSVGAASSKSVAKIASDLKKPDGLVVVPPGAERVFLAPLPVGRLWGVGPRAEEHLARIGVRTIGELAALDRRWLEDRFGKWGAMLHDLARGHDSRPVTTERETKSVSAETTFAEDTADPKLIGETLIELVAQVVSRLRRHSIKLRDARFETHTRQRTLASVTDEQSVILAAAQRLIAPELTPGRRLRLLGVGVSGFYEAVQLELPWDTALDAGDAPYRAPPGSTSTDVASPALLPPA